MPKFEQVNSQTDGNKGDEEARRLYGNDLSAKKFSTKPYEGAGSISENAALFGGQDDASAEEKIYERITSEEMDENNLVLGKQSNDYLNGIGKAPKDLTIDEIRASALAYRESLSEEEQLKEDGQATNLIREDIKEKKEVKYTEAADLKPGMVAHATPDSLETTKLNRRSLWDYIAGRKEKV